MTIFIAGVTLEEVREATVSILNVRVNLERKALRLGAGSLDRLDIWKETLDKVQSDKVLDDTEQSYLKGLLNDNLQSVFLDDEFENEVHHNPTDLRATVTTAFTYTAAIRHYCM